MVIVIASLVYSIGQAVITNENSTDTPNINDVTPITPSLILFTRTMPIPDKIVSNKTIDDELYSEAALRAEQDLKRKNDIEEQIPSLQLRSPSYRHQKVVYTMEKGRNLSRMGYLEEYATRHLSR